MYLSDFTSCFLRIFSMNIFIFYILFKLINYKHISLIKKIMITIFCVLYAYFYATLYIKFKIVNIYLIILLFIFNILISSNIAKDTPFSLPAVNLLAASINYTIFFFCLSLSIVIIYFINPKITTNNIFDFLLSILFEVIFLYYLFRFPKFKYGFTFLKKENINYKINIAILIITELVIFIYSCCRFYVIGDTTEQIVIVMGFILTSIIVALFIPKQFTNVYSKKHLIKVKLELEKEVENYKNEIRKIEKENYNLSSIIHKYSHQFKVLELEKQKLQEKYFSEKCQTELSQDFSNFFNLSFIIQDNFSNELNNKIKVSKKLPKTGILDIDASVEYWQAECEKQNIEFDIKYFGNLYYLINNIISKNSLITLINDHIKDATIAVNSKCSRL